MPQLSRRTLFALAPAGAAGLTLGTALQARADGGNDTDRILTNATAMLAGTAQSNTDPAAAPVLERIQDQARHHLADAEDAGPGEVFAGLPLGEVEANLSDTLDHLAAIALATRTPEADSELVGDTETQHWVLEQTELVHSEYLADIDAGYYGNWYEWEIGIPTALTRLLVLLAEELEAEQVRTYVATMDDYLQNGVDGDVDLDSRFHTGANLADITTNRILQGALTGDDARISKAISDQATAYATIDPYNLRHDVTDGYYADGSFIQHHTVAYTGSYGRTLLTRVLQTITILDGAQVAGEDADPVDPEELPGVVFDWVQRGFAPLIFQGWMMESVKGRAVSRTASGYADVGSIVEATVDLIDHSTNERADALAAYVKYLGTIAPEPTDTSGWLSPVTVVRHAEIMVDDAVEPADLHPERAAVAFNAMDRAVYRREGFAFALSRSSERISQYEYMSGENLRPWFSGTGAFHLYLSGQDQAEVFGAQFLAVVPPDRLPGASAPDEQRESVPELYGQQWYENPDHPLEFTSDSESQNTYVYFPVSTNAHSGGAVLAEHASSAMVLADDVPWRDKQAGILPEDFVAYAGIRGTKSWFALGDAIVVLAAGIHDPRERGPVTTTLDARVAAPEDDVQLTGADAHGTAWDAADGDGSSPADLAWLRWANRTTGAAVAYAVLDGPPVGLTHEETTGNLQSVRESNPDTEVTRQVFTATVGHGAPDLAYVILPGGDAERARACREGAVVVAANSEQMQAVRHPTSGITAMNTFTEGTHTVRRLGVDGPACVLMREEKGQVEIAVSDPTMARDRITLSLRGGRAPRVIEADDGVAVDLGRGRTRITVDTQEAYGRTFVATLARR